MINTALYFNKYLITSLNMFEKRIILREHSSFTMRVVYRTISPPTHTRWKWITVDVVILFEMLLHWQLSGFGSAVGLKIHLEWWKNASQGAQKNTSWRFVSLPFVDGTPLSSTFLFQRPLFPHDKSYFFGSSHRLQRYSFTLSQGF